MVIWPRSAPTALGEYTTWSAQVLWPGSDVPQRLFTEKSPVIATSIFVNALSPLFVTVTCCAALVVPIVCAAKVRTVALSVSVGPVCPLPLSNAVCVPTSSVATRLPDAAPDAVGEKTTPTVQLVFTAKEAPQVFADMENGPLMLKGFNRDRLWPVLATVTYCTGLVCPMRTEPKSSRSGVSTTVLPWVPWPCRSAVRTPPCTFAISVTVAVRGPVAVGANTIEMAQEAPAARLAGH